MTDLLQEAKEENRVFEYPDKEAWLRGRMSSSGASEVAAILGAHPYMTRLEVYESKVSQELIQKQFTPEAEERMRWGLLHESTIGVEFGSRHRAEIHDPGQFTIVTHPELELLSCTPDRLTIGAKNFLDADGTERNFTDLRAPIEIKTTDRMFKDDWSDGSPPLQHVIQVQAQLACLGQDWNGGFISVLFSGNHYEDFYIPRDQEFIDKMLEGVQNFWDCFIIPEIPPEPTASEADKAVLARLYSVPSGEIRELQPGSAVTEEAEKWKAIYQTAQEAEKEAKSEKTEAQNHLKAIMAEDSFLKFPDGSGINGKLVERKGYEVQPSSYRNFRLSKKLKVN